MSEEDQDQKTEEPTGKRLGEAREKGQIPVSREVSAWTLFVGVLIVVAWLGKPATEDLFNMLRFFIEMPHIFNLDDRGLQALLFQIIGKTILVTGLCFIVLAGAAILGIMSQTGFFASLDLITPSLERLNPLAGFKKLFSINALFDFAKSVLKMIFLGTVAFFAIWPVAKQMPLYADHPMMEVLAILHKEAVHLITNLLLAFTIIAVADLCYQRYQYIKNLRMTKTEVKDEYKQQEGDPAIKGRLRQMRMEKARKRMMSQVPKADVIITNPTHYAVALEYDVQKSGAPVVLAKGINLIAEKIKEIATENDIPLVSNPPLARGLYDSVEIDQEIPPEHYKAVAQVISYIYKLKKKRP